MFCVSQDIVSQLCYLAPAVPAVSLIPQWEWCCLLLSGAILNVQQEQSF